MIRLLHDQPGFSEMSCPICFPAIFESKKTQRISSSIPSELRLARALLLLGRFGNEDEPIPVIPKISRQTLAAMIGTTRSRVSFFRNKFKRLGFIH